MTSFIGDAGVHQLPPAIIAQDATKAAAQLRASFALLQHEIVQSVVVAILNSLGFSPAQIAQLFQFVKGAETFLANPVGYIQQVIAPNSPVFSLQNQLSGALGGIIPAALDNLDGTATQLGSQIVQNLDGTANLSNQPGTTPVNTLIDTLDGTAVSLGTAVNNMIQGFGTHAYALQTVTQTLAGVGANNANQLVSALQGVIPAALDNLDGTAVAIGTQVVQNLDGTATYIAQAVSNANTALAQASSGINGLIDNLDGTAMSFFHAASQGVNNTLGGLLHAFTGNPVTGTIATQAQQAQVATAAGAIQQRLAGIGNGAEEQVDVEFSAFTSGAIPAAFTEFTFGGGAGTAPAVSGGLLTVTSSSAVNHLYRYNATTTLTDFQQVTGIWPTVVQGTGGSTPILFGRLDVTGLSSLIRCQYTASSGGWITTAETGGSLVLQITFTDTFTNGATYSLMCGDPATSNPYKFSILKNGTPLALASVTTGDTSQPTGQLYYIDTSHATTVGASSRFCGLGFVIGSGTTGTISMSSFQFQDTIQSSPSVLVTTSESTTSATYTDLATISDQVVVNIGTSGIALVALSVQSSSNQVNGSALMSFALSGANTQAATDTYATGIAQAVNTSTETIGAPFLLVGLAQGLTTFKAKYRAQGAGTSTFANRRIGVVAL